MNNRSFSSIVQNTSIKQENGKNNFCCSHAGLALEETAGESSAVAAR